MLTIHGHLCLGKNLDIWQTCQVEAFGLWGRVFDLRIVWGRGCREEDVKKEFCEDSVLSWLFRALYGWMWRPRHGLGHHNTEGWRRPADMGSLFCLVSALGFLQMLSNSSSTLNKIEWVRGTGESRCDMTSAFWFVALTSANVTTVLLKVGKKHALFPPPPPRRQVLSL